MSFTGDEVLEIAEKIERNGAKFYRRAAELATDERAKGLFEKLADWEDSHEAIYAAMREEFKPEDFLFDPEQEAHKYIQAIAEGKIFDADKMPADVEKASTLEILQRALEREKDTVCFFSAMKQLVPSEGGKKKVEGIIEEEMSHIRFIVELVDIFAM